VPGAVPDRGAPVGAAAHPQMAEEAMGLRIGAVARHPADRHAPGRPRMPGRALKRIAPPVRTDD